MLKLLSPKHIKHLLFCIAVTQFNAQAEANEVSSKKFLKEQALILEDKESPSEKKETSLSKTVDVKLKNEFGKGIRLEIFSMKSNKAIGVIYLHGYENDRDIVLEPAVYEFKVYSLENEYMGYFQRDILANRSLNLVAISRFILQ